MITLRPYQLDAIDRVRQRVRAGVRRILLVAATGAGKTTIASHIIECSLALDNRILFLAHRRELIVQAWKRLIGCGCPAGFDHVRRRHPDCSSFGLEASQVGILMANDYRRNPRAPIQVASIDTLRSRAKPPADLIVVDEAHRSVALSYRKILAEYPDATVIGLTATPYRADGRGLGNDYDELVVVASPRELIADGFLVEPRAFTVPANELPKIAGVRVKGGDYDVEELATAVNQKHLVGNIVDHWQRRAEGRKTVVFAVNVQHSKDIVDRFRDAGIAAEHLDGATPTAERDAILARLESGETRVVSNCAVLCEGWDQPSVKCVILSRPTKSLGLYLQTVGRILRPYRGIGALILDHAGNVVEHGLPQDDREFSLDVARKKRAAKAPSVRTCEQCFAVLPGETPVCPACGFVFPVSEAASKSPDEVDGELVEVHAATVEEKRAYWGELVATANARGYKPGWAFHRFTEKFRTRPPREWPRPNDPPPRVYTETQKRAYLEDLKAQRSRNGYAITWVYRRYIGRFQETVPVAWMLPSVAAALTDADPEVEPEPATIVEWAV